MSARAASLVVALFAAALACGPAPASAALGDPLAVFSPEPPTQPNPPAPPLPIEPPPTGYLNGPCGLALDSDGRIYVADHYHDVVDVFTAGFGYRTQHTDPDPDTGPCALALDSAGDLYVGDYHGGVEKLAPSEYPPDGDTTYASQWVIDSPPSTGLAVDPLTDEVYVNRRTHVAVYDSTGAPVMDGPDPLQIGLGTLGDGYGLSVSGYTGTAGRVYVADAADDTVKVYDPSLDTVNPIQVIDGSATSAGEFASLRDASIAVDSSGGDIYVADTIDLSGAEQPRARVYVFDATGGSEGHLKYDVVGGGPTGLAVDGSQHLGRVYVTSGNTHHAGIYVYPPESGITAAPLAPTIPPEPLGGDSLFPTVPIGGPILPPGGILCEGDNCQDLPSPPGDPTLTTRLRGLGNPKVRFADSTRDCGAIARGARKAGRKARRSTRRAKRVGDPRKAKALRARARKLRKRSRRAARSARRCRRQRAGGSASASAALSAPSNVESSVSSATGESDPAVAAAPAGGGEAATTLSLSPAPAGFDAAALADGGEAATLAGSHPYSVRLSVGVDQGGGDSDLSGLRLDFPNGLLVNPAATPLLCSDAEFQTPRSSPFDLGSTSGESCPDLSQVGTVQVTSGAGGGETRAFGLFNLDPDDGTAMQLGAAPFGAPLVFDGTLRVGGEEAFGLSLDASQVPAALQAEAVSITLWGVPWDASHNTERGNCLNESEPDFSWSKCSVGDPLNVRPLAFLTLPTECSGPLSFAARAETWQGTGEFEAQAVNRDAADDPAPLTGCGELDFESVEMLAEGVLSTEKASSSAGFTFRLTNDDENLANPRARIRSHPERALVELPEGVTLNPSLGAGLRGCTPAQLAAETAFNAPGSGCPNGSKIGEFSVRTPLYDGLLRGSIYLATPRDNPFDSLLAVYLVAKSADRGLLIRLPGELRPDPGDGTITAIFEGLPQLPYSELEVEFRSGQRAPLVSPPRCGGATTRIELEPSSGGAAATFVVNSAITSGIDFGPCPDGSTPAFSPGAVAGGVNSNVGSYTPYYVHLSREDEEQEITSYSLILPKGITGKLSGIPFCSDAAIDRARGRGGFDEIADPSCPSASQVGRTDTGYGVGPALTYAPGRIYLAGPYGGQPLSLVTINAATVGPFDLGTIVIRSAFSVDPRTAQLQIDSSASDPIPHIIEGVPLHLRDIRIHMDRDTFTRNPTGCQPSELVSTLTGSGADFGSSADDSTASVSEHFQLLNCLDLGFRPKLGLRLLGGVGRNANPALRTVLRARAGDASMKRITVTMPRALFLAQQHIRGICTRPQFAAERCPRNSIYGRAVVYSSLFDDPLRGPVFLRSSDNPLPDLVASLRSGEVRIVLEGRIGPSKQGGIRAFFDNVPDAPIEAFVMQLNGGKRGLLANSVNVCKTPPTATVKSLGQNNRGVAYTTKLRGNCKKFNAAQKRRQRLRKKRAQQRQKRRQAARRNNR